MARRRGTGAKVGIGCLVLLVLLVVLAVAADRVAVGYAENRAAAQLETELDTPAVPEVDIEGFPFLTQVLGRSLSSVHVVALDVSPPDRPGTALGDVDLRLRDVTSPDRFQTLTAAQVDGTVAVDYASAKQIAGHPLTYARDGLVEITMQTSIVSIPVTAKIVGRPTVDVAAQTFTLTEPEITVAGVDVPQATSQALMNTLLKPVKITGIPYGLTVTGVTATPDGLQVGVTGREVSFSR